MGKPRQPITVKRNTNPSRRPISVPAAEERTLESAHQNQDQEYNQYQPESSATVVARAIERAASDSTETSKQRDNDYDE
jgi:hypothetical protein